jgi:MerR family Zn(II)-responsive transcriptional regulator of zntA
MLTIGKIARETNVSADALRYYEREGLIVPAGKSDGGYRLYGKDAIPRLRFIKQAQACGFTLTEIRELLVLRNSNSACCGDVRTRAVEKKLQLEGKIRALKTMSKALDQLIANCPDAKHGIEECSILAALEEAPVKRRVRGR